MILRMIWKIWTDLSSILSQITHLTDRRTDGQTEFTSLDRVCNACSAVKTAVHQKVNVLNPHCVQRRAKYLRTLLHSLQVPASAGKAKAGMVHFVSGWTRGVQVKLWDPLRTRAIPERLTGVFTMRRYTNRR